MSVETELPFAVVDVEANPEIRLAKFASLKEAKTHISTTCWEADTEKVKRCGFRIDGPGAIPENLKYVPGTGKKLGTRKAVKKAKTMDDVVKKKPPVTKAGGEGKPGIIDTIVEMVSRKSGATIDEIVEKLTERFPERSADGMRNTAKIQARKKSNRSEATKRGKTFYKD